MTPQQEQEFRFRLRLEQEQESSNPKPTMYEKTAQSSSTVDNLLAGVGGSMYGKYLGGKQMLMEGLDFVNPLDKNLSGLVTGKQPSRAGAMQGDIDEHKKAMQGLRETKAGYAGDVVGNLAMLAPTMNPFTATLRGAAMIGGADAALNPTSDGESRLLNMGLGAGFGAAGQWGGDKLMGALVGRRAIRPTARSSGSATASSTGGSASASSTLSATPTVTGSGGGAGFGTVGDDASAGLTSSQRGLIARTRDRYRLTPGQATGSRALQQLEAKLESQPMTSGPFNTIKDHNQTQVNRAAANAIGETSDVVDSAVLANAHDRIQSVYRFVADGRTRNIDTDPFLSRVAAIETDFEGLLPVGSVLDDPLVKRLWGYAERGGATGEQLQNISSKLSKKAYNQMTSAMGDRELGLALSQVKELADDLLEEGMNAATRARFSEARSQYRNMMLLTGRNGIVNPSSGNVQPGALAALLQQKDKAGFLRGGNTSPLYDAARFGQAFKPIVGDSGTATRSMIPSPTDFVLSLPFNLATRAYTSAPAVNLAANAGAIARNGIAPRMNPGAVRLLPQLGAQGGLLGGGMILDAQ